MASPASRYMQPYDIVHMDILSIYLLANGKARKQSKTPQGCQKTRPLNGMLAINMSKWKRMETKEEGTKRHARDDSCQEVGISVFLFHLGRHESLARIGSRAPLGSSDLSSNDTPPGARSQGGQEKKRPRCRVASLLEGMQQT